MDQIKNQYAREILESVLKRLSPEQREMLSKDNYGVLFGRKFKIPANYFLEEGIAQQLKRFTNRQGLVYYFDIDTNGVSKVVVELTSEAFMNLDAVKEHIVKEFIKG